MSLRPRVQLAFVSVLVVFGLTGCMMRRPSKARVGQPRTVAFQINVDANANDNSVVPFDAVVIRDKKLLQQISQMDAAAWFSAKGRCNYRGGAKAKVEFHSWEFVPGQTFLIDVPSPGGVKGILGFANYATPGDHRVTLKSSGSQIVNLREDGIQGVTTAAFANSKAPPPAPEKQGVCPDN
jgi:type VI secretion system protein